MSIVSINPGIDPLDMIPQSVFLKCLKYLSISDLNSAALVCKRWCQITLDRSLWKELVLPSISQHNPLLHDPNIPFKRAYLMHRWNLELHNHFEKGHVEEQIVPIEAISCFHAFGDWLFLFSKGSIDQGTLRLFDLAAFVEIDQISVTGVIKSLHAAPRQDNTVNLFCGYLDGTVEIRDTDKMLQLRATTRLDSLPITRMLAFDGFLIAGYMGGAGVRTQGAVLWNIAQLERGQSQEMHRFPHKWTDNSEITMLDRRGDLLLVGSAYDINVWKLSTRTLLCTVGSPVVLQNEGIGIWGWDGGCLFKDVLQTYFYDGLSMQVVRWDLNTIAARYENGGLGVELDYRGASQNLNAISYFVEQSPCEHLGQLFGVSNNVADLFLDGDRLFMSSAPKEDYIYRLGCIANKQQLGRTFDLSAHNAALKSAQVAGNTLLFHVGDKTLYACRFTS